MHSLGGLVLIGKVTCSLRSSPLTHVARLAGCCSRILNEYNNDLFEDIFLRNILVISLNLCFVFTFL